VGAITHVARVVNLISNVPTSEVASLLKGQSYSIQANKEEEFKIFRFAKPVPLKYKITEIGNKTAITFSPSSA